MIVKTKIIQAVLQSQLLQPTNKILIGVSGGIDSMVLLDVLFALKPTLNLEIAIAHCNFNLRGVESDADQNFVEAQAEKYGLQLFVKNFDTPTILASSNSSVQMLARDLRYQWFDELLADQNFQRIALAHHLDDNIETFFMHLFRGSGVKGLAAIPVQRGSIIRPLLNCTRADIETYSNENNIAFRNDSSNDKDDYLRNRLRHHLVPLLKDLEPNYQEQMNRSIAHLRSVADFLGHNMNQLAEQLLETIPEGGFKISLAHLRQHQQLNLVLFEILHPFGFNPSQIQSILSFVSPYQTSNQKESILPHHNAGQVIESPTWKVYKEADQLVLVPIHSKSLTPYQVKVNPVPLEGWRNRPTNPNLALVDADLLEKELQIKPWQPGDRFQPLGMTQFKKISDFLIDQKVPIRQKEALMLVWSGDKIVWVVGHRLDNRFKITPSTQHIVEISVVAV